MSLRTTFVLMIVFMVVGSFAFFDPFGWEAKKEEKEEREQYVYWLKDKKVSSFSIEKEGQTILLTCKRVEGCPFDGTGDWEMKTPVVDLADPAAVGSLASAVLNMTFVDKVDFGPGELQAQEFGLGKAKVLVQVQGEAKPRTLILGGSAPAGPNVYIQDAEQPNRLYVVASFFAQMLEKDLFHWRNKRIFPEIESDQVEELSFTGKIAVNGQKLDGKWKLLSPVQTPGNQIQWEGLVSTVVYLNAKALHTVSGSLGKPELVVRLKAKGNTAKDPKAAASNGVREIQFFPKKNSQNGEWIAVEGQRSFVVESYPLERFRKPLIEYRERKLFPQRVYADLEKVHFQFPREKSEIRFTKQKEDWQPEEKSDPISQTRIRTFLLRLFDMDAEFFVDKNSQGAKLLQSQVPDLVVEIEGKGFREKRKFLVVGRKSALTEGLIAAEAASMGENFLKWMPIRKSDFLEANNKTVMPEGVKEEEEDGHEHSHGDDPHHGHQH